MRSAPFLGAERRYSTLQLVSMRDRSSDRGSAGSSREVGRARKGTTGVKETQILLQMAGSRTIERLSFIFLNSPNPSGSPFDRLIFDSFDLFFSAFTFAKLGQ